MVFVNPPRRGITLEESLRMGGRHTAFRLHEGVAYTTWVVVERMDPEPVVYRVEHVARRGEDLLLQKGQGFEDLNAALLWLLEVHEVNV